jgi:hypothetical protein
MELHLPLQFGLVWRIEPHNVNIQKEGSCMMSLVARRDGSMIGVPEPPQRHCR